MSSTVIPTMRYADAPAMIEWLCDVFGFEKHMVVDDGDGGIAHAQLTLGPGMIMLGSQRDDDFGRLQRTPEALGGTTQSPYLVVSDVDAVAENARVKGAEILIEPRDEAHGGRFFSCRDPEGHLWNVGSYDPWTE